MPNDQQKLKWKDLNKEISKQKNKINTQGVNRRIWTPYIRKQPRINTTYNIRKSNTVLSLKIAYSDQNKYPTK